MNKKPRLSFAQIWNMSFGFLGIQFGWGLQMANMSSIYEHLGAKAGDIPMLWLAGPITGLLIQPIIGYMSDRTWTGLGRRKPYFLTGAVLASLALVAMPNSPSLWIAAGLLWIMDASINITMEPFRAFVGDMLPKEQHTQGFTMQSFFIGLGAVIASLLPFLFTNVFHVDNTAAAGQIPLNVKLSFYIGSVAFIGAVLFTVMKTKEYTPEEMARFEAAEEAEKTNADKEEEKTSFVLGLPKVMWQLSAVQFFTWPALFLMWFYFSGATTRTVFHYQDYPERYSEYYKSATSPDAKPLTTEATEEINKHFKSVEEFKTTYKENEKRQGDGGDWTGICFAFYSVVTFLFAFGIEPISKKYGRKQTHAVCLLIGAMGLASVPLMHDKYALLISMAGVGIAWASILSMPYSMLASNVPAKNMGLYMGIFNLFIVIPEVLANVSFGPIMTKVLHDDRSSALYIGGVLLVVAAIFTVFVHDKLKVKAA